MRRSRGFRSKTRQKLKGGRFSIAESLQVFNPGDKVRFNINPAVHSGMPHPRYKGEFGKVLEKRGRSFIVEMKAGDKVKRIIAKPEHLQPVKK